jgi:hypothetical protein
VFNAGHQIGPLPSHVVVETDWPGAYWCSLAGAEAIALTDAATRPFAPLEDAPDWLIAMARAAVPPPE